MRYLTLSIIFLLLVGSVAATGYLIRSQPNPALLNNAGYHAYQNGDVKAAEAFFKASLALAPQYERARYNLALLYFHEGRYAEAQPLFDELLKLDPENAQYHFDGAANYVARFRQKGVATTAEFEHAIAEYELADKLSPGFPHAASNARVLRKIEQELSA